MFYYIIYYVYNWKLEIPRMTKGSFRQICPQSTAKVNPHSRSLPVPMPTYNMLSVIIVDFRSKF